MGSRARAPRPLAALPNLGPRSARALAKVGVRTEARLRELGALETFLRLKKKVPGTSYNFLYALYGALSGALFTDFPPEIRAQMRAQAEARLGPLENR